MVGFLSTSDVHERRKAEDKLANIERVYNRYKR